MTSLLKTHIKPRLNPGKYPISLVSYKEMENDKGGYVEVTLSFPDRVMRQNFFPSNIEYLGKTLRTQMGMEEGADLDEILEAAKNSDKPLFAVVSYGEYGLNIAFHETVVTENKEVTA